MAELMARGHRPAPGLHRRKGMRPISCRAPNVSDRHPTDDAPWKRIPMKKYQRGKRQRAQPTYRRQRRGEVRSQTSSPKRRTLRRKIGRLWMPWSAAQFGELSKLSTYDNGRSSLQLCAWSPKSQLRGMRKGPRYMVWKNSATGEEDWGKMNQRPNYYSNTSGTTCCATSWELQQQWRYGSPAQRPARGRLPPPWTIPTFALWGSRPIQMLMVRHARRKNDLRIPQALFTRGYHQTEGEMHLSNAAKSENNI